jgi:dGTPase
VSKIIDLQFQERLHEDPPRPDDRRDPYERDKARIIHSAAFRRLQGKTQVMGVGEGDFHRTRLTHSIEAGQIGEGLLTTLRHRHFKDTKIINWLPTNALMIAACYAHDIGHPPYGHAGERALQSRMFDRGGFESNAQTLRILTKLETFRHHQGINPTRRTMLAVLKYPAPYSSFDSDDFKEKPPKCYYNLEEMVVAWALAPFQCEERRKLAECDVKSRPKFRTLDASIMEYADDIAYAVHDIEDIVARELVSREELSDHTPDLFINNGAVGTGENRVTRDEFIKGLFDERSVDRKRLIGRLVNLLVVEARMEKMDGFGHPLLCYRLRLPHEYQSFLDSLKGANLQTCDPTRGG